MRYHLYALLLSLFSHSNIFKLKAFPILGVSDSAEEDDNDADDDVSNGNVKCFNVKKIEIKLILRSKKKVVYNEQSIFL